MRTSACLLVACAALLATRPARAASLCDPAGHFCLVVDTTSAFVCTPLRPGGLTVESCSASDGEVRKMARRLDEATHGAMRAVDALVVRFDELTASITLIRRPAEPEAGGDTGAREAMRAGTQLLTRARDAGWLVEELQPPTLLRVNNVQVGRLEMRLSSAGIGGAQAIRRFAYEVRTRDAAYVVTFDGPDAQAERLSTLADSSIATLDAIPLKRATSAGDAITWLVRGVVAAVVLAGLVWLLGRRKGRRPAFDSRDLWPR